MGTDVKLAKRKCNGRHGKYIISTILRDRTDGSTINCVDVKSTKHICWVCIGSEKNKSTTTNCLICSISILQKYSTLFPKHEK